MDILVALQNSCRFILRTRVQLVILVIIALNAISLGIETSKNLSPQVRLALEYFDTSALFIYVIELTLKHIALGFRFWASGWNIFDFIIVAVSFVPAGSSLSILRGLRILRVLRLVSSIKPLKRIVIGLLQSIPSIGWLSLLVMINFYLFAVIGTNFFGAKFPDFFGSIGASSFTLFQIMTLESWSMGIARPVIAEYEFAYIYFVVFILLNTFVMLNLFVGIIVSAMSSIDDSQTDDNMADAENQGQLTGNDVSTKVRLNQEELGLQLSMLKQQLSAATQTIARLEGKLNGTSGNMADKNDS